MNGLSRDQHSTQPQGNRKLAQDLTCIRGIGAAKKQWLESLGIDTIETLAEVVAEDLRTQLKKLGYTISQNELEGWIQQAKAICPSRQPELEASSAQIPTQSETYSCTTIASFHINFQTCSSNEIVEQKVVIQNLETGRVKNWSTIISNELQDWMLAAVEENFKAALLQESSSPMDAVIPAESSVEAIESDIPPATIQIAQIRIQQLELGRAVIAIHRSNPIVVETLMTDSPIELELAIDLVDSDIDPALPLTYHATCQAKHLATGAVLNLGEARTIPDSSNSARCLLRLPPIVLQTPGAYRLMAFASLEAYPLVTTCLKVSGLQLQSSASAVYRVNQLQMSCGI